MELQKGGMNVAKVKVTVSLEEDTHKRLKALAYSKRSTVSSVISNWVWSAQLNNADVEENFFSTKNEKSGLLRSDR